LFTTLGFYYTARAITIKWDINWNRSVTLPSTIPTTTLSKTTPYGDNATVGGGSAGGCLLLNFPFSAHKN